MRPRKAGAPLAVKLLVVAAVILLGVYLLGRQRDKALVGGALERAPIALS